MIRVGIIGWNEEIKILASEIHSKIKNTELLGWATTHKEGLAYAKKLGLKHVFRSASELYEIHQLDVICFFNSGEDHETLVEDALKAGVNVFVDFPLAHNVDEALHLKQIVEHFPSLKSLIVFPRRYVPQLVEIKKILDENKLGDINQINISNFKTIDPFLTDKGIFMNQMIEDVDMIHWLLNDKIIQTTAIGSSSVDKKLKAMEDVNQASAIGYTEKGTTYNLFSKNDALKESLTIEVWGTEGKLIFTTDSASTIGIRDSSGMTAYIPLSPDNKYQDIFEYFVHKIEQGDRISSDINDAVDATKVAVALSKSFVLKTSEEISF